MVWRSIFDFCLELLDGLSRLPPVKGGGAVFHCDMEKYFRIQRHLLASMRKNPMYDFSSWSSMTSMSPSAVASSKSSGITLPPLHCNGFSQLLESPYVQDFVSKLRRLYFWRLEGIFVDSSAWLAFVSNCGKNLKSFHSKCLQTRILRGNVRTISLLVSYLKIFEENLLSLVLPGYDFMLVTWEFLLRKFLGKPEHWSSNFHMNVSSVRWIAPWATLTSSFPILVNCRALWLWAHENVDWSLLFP